jgi:hypothetical protein
MVDLRDFIKFLRDPSLGKQFDIKSISAFLKLVWISFLILLGIDIATGFLILTPLRHFNLLPVLKEINLNPFNFLKATLLLPIIEELIFRLPLRISKVNVITSFSIIIFLFMHKLCISNIYLAISLSIMLFLSLYLCIKEEFNILNKLTIFFTNHFRLIIYSQALIFGFLHLTNYKVDFKYFYLFPLFSISNISSGYLWGYIRVRYTFGIYVCIASHIAVNSIYCLILSR